VAAVKAATFKENLMDFPRAVYTSPGPNKCQGGTFGAEVVKDKGEMDAALKAGFFATLPEALKGSTPKLAVKKEA
jgi:hypothetical protein